MSLTRQEAFSILDVPRGSSEDHIRSAYKKLALKWHPDKHANSDEATKKFQDISAAYKRLTTEDDHADVILTPEDMFDLFAQMFFAQRTSFRAYNGFNFGRDSTDEDEIEDESDDDDDECDFTFRENIRFSYPFPPNPSSSSKKSKPTVYSYTARRPTASEASKNAEELMKEEERQRKQREKKKAKKKRQKDKKKLEKEKKEQEVEDKRKLAAEKKKEEEEEEACPVKEQVESSSASESDSDVSEADEEIIVTQIKVDSSKKSSNNKNSSSKSKSSNNNLLNGHISGHGDATKVKMSPSTTNSDKKARTSNGIDKKSAATNGIDKKSAATTNDKKPSSTTTEKKTTPIKKTKKEPTHNHIASSSDSDSDQEETTGLDPRSAFFAHAAAAASKKINSQPQPKPKKEKEDKNKINGKKKSEDADSIEDMDPVILRSRQSAVKGNEMANLGHYQAAVELFSQAIQLNPRDFRFFGNRSFCYDRLDKFDKALKDAEKAISLAKDWPKGHFRKGRALSGLRRYADAENAFEQVLRLDKNCEEAVEELRRVRGYQLMEMGFTRQQSEAAIRQYGSVSAALEVLLIQGAPGEVSSQAFDEDVYLSDDEDYITETIEQSKTDVENPEGLRSLWIGNVQPTVSEKELRDLFGKFGELQSVRRLNDKFCCFINFKRASQAATAMSQLQGQHLHGRLLLIKFPDNPIIEGQPRITVLKKTQQPQQQQTKQSKQQQKQQQAPTPKQTQQVNDSQQTQDKLSGPVNGDECYFWRTTGCAYGDGCRHKHIKGNKGVDRKPWQKNLYKN